MKSIKNVLKLVKPSIIKLTPYASARSELKAADSSGELQDKPDFIYLDANENPYGSAVELPYVNHDINRYPDPLSTELRKKISQIKSVDISQVFVGNGSDEAIDLLIRIFCQQGKDKIIITPPTYGMYKVIADVQQVEVKKADLDSEFQLQAGLIKKALTKDTKIFFICSPNNPTGNAYSIRDIESLVKAAKGIVVVDEAYIDFSSQQSALKLLKKYKNLVVLQTLSKAWGMAGARVGCAFAAPEIIDLMFKIKAPYNLSALAQSAALEALQNKGFLDSSVKRIIEQREKLADSLILSPEVERVYPSDANYLLVKFKDGRKTYTDLLKKGIVLRDRSSVPETKNCIRITVGNEQENLALLAALGVSDADYSDGLYAESRKASYRRHTKETDIKLEISDKISENSINTGIGFLDHMLTLFAVHSGLNIRLICKGDLHVDSHHSLEDCAIALGAALREFLADSMGINRYGFYLPMDESSCQVALDLSGRNHLKWHVNFNQQNIAGIPVSLFEHFFKSFSDNARLTLHIKAEGRDDHHIIEAVFKAVARALAMAISRNHGSQVPSSKGVL